MKKIFKLLFLTFIVITISSCDNQDQELLTVSAIDSGTITAPASGFTQILNPEENQLNTAFTLTWSAADFGVPTSINYTVEFALSGTNFADAFLAGATTNTNLTWNITEFNGAVVSTGLAPFVQGSLDIRIISTIGDVASTPQISETITVLITPFTTDLPTIAVPGNHQGWDPPTAPVLAASAFGATDYVGYVWLDGGYKFVGPNSTGDFFWGNTDWGDDSSFTGKLLETDEVDCNADVAGYYFVTADTNALTYSTFLTNWGLIGSATPDNWDSDQDMTYDPVTRTLKITIDLTAEEIKFRANDDWALNFGDDGADGTLEEGAANIAVPEAGNYTVTLDLSVPREFTYSLIKN